MEGITYDQVMRVTRSWDNLKLLPNHEKRAGELIFLKLFELEPRIAVIFELDPNDKNVTKTRKFAILTRIVFDMIDCAVGFLGPDLDPLAEELQELGKRHIHYNLEPQFLDHMGVAVIYALGKMVGTVVDSKSYSHCLREEEEKAWIAVYSFMATNMSAGLEKAMKARKLQGASPPSSNIKIGANHDGPAGRYYH